MLKDKMSVAEYREYLKTKEAKRQSKNRISEKIKKINKKPDPDDSKLWKVFSEYIRLKYSDDAGICFCYTCGRPGFWREMDCGHGIGRQHKATKYEEINNRPQCGNCNGFEGGKREVFKERMNKEHGAGTWEMLELKAKGVVKFTDFEIEVMIKFYKTEVYLLKEFKSLR